MCIWSAIRMSFTHPKVTNIMVGKDISWSDNLIHALRRLNEEYVFLFIDDLLLSGPVDTASVIEVLLAFMDREGNYLRMNPRPRPDRALNSFFGLVSRGTIYRTATVSSFWKKQTLLKLLVSGETPWEFEIYGTVRSDAYDGFYSTHKRLLTVVNTVIKGKWERGALAKIQSLGVRLELGDRPLMTRAELFRFRCCLLRNQVLYLLPPLMRRRVKGVFTRGK